LARRHQRRRQAPRHRVGAQEVSRFKPVYACDRPFRRSGRTNQRLSIEDATHTY
jgi:hypothetical protein